MITCTITIDGEFFCGRNPHKQYSPGHCLHSSGWTSYAGGELDMPMIGGDSPKLIEGRKELQNTLTDIADWLDEGIIPDAKEILIKLSR